MKKKPIFQAILLVLLVVAVFLVGFKLGQSQVHERIANAWNETFGEATETAPTEILNDDNQDPFAQDPFGDDPFAPSNTYDPFANSLGPFQGDATVGQR